MNHIEKSFKPRLRSSLVLTHTLVAFTTVLLAELCALVYSIAAGAEPHRTWHIVLVVLLATAFGALLGIWFNRSLLKRIERTLEITRSWLRGMLGVRIGDLREDEFGVICRQLDDLALHLEQDEQDLERLRQSNAVLTDQVRALAVVEERNRLARELHDNVKQHLFSLTMTASAIRTRFDGMPAIPGDLREMAQEIESSAHRAQRETTRLIEDLRPGSLEQQGLAAALNDAALLFGAREHVLVYLDIACHDSALPAPIAEALYRVAQEALHNVARHAHATRVDLRLHCNGDLVSLRVEDNGIGFDPSTVQRGLGVANMQERLMAVGGRLTIESRPGEGAVVEAEASISGQPATAGMEDRPSLDRDRWAWLGQRLEIPVGQDWPWLPVEQERFLRHPQIETTVTPLFMRRERSWLGVRSVFSLYTANDRKPLVRLARERAGYQWESMGAAWALRHISGQPGRNVLFRNAQALAAMQYQGRQMETWTEIIYDDRAYRLDYTEKGFTLADEAGRVLLQTPAVDSQMTMHRALPLPLLAIVAARIIDESNNVTTPRSS